MKNLILILLFLGFSGALSAQSKFGILSYPLPDSWETMQVGNNLLLFNPSNPGCRIGLFPTTGTPIDTDEKFMELRSQKINELGFQNFYSDPIERSEVDGWLILSSKTEINSPQAQWGYTFTISNQTESAGLIYETNSAPCIEEIAQILTQLTAEPTTSSEPVVLDPKNPKRPEKIKPLKDIRGKADPQKSKGKGNL